jgi:hypothetical protein
MNQTVVKAKKADIKAELWRRGILRYTLHPAQQDLYDLYWSSTDKINMWLCGRRLGKTRTLVTIAIEECLRNSNSIIKLIAPSAKQMEMIVLPQFTEVLMECPELLMPKYHKKMQTYVFKNGSEIHLAGADNGNAERLRGSACRTVFIDEAASIDDIDNIVKNIALPTTLTTKGKVILATTPPVDSEHPIIKYITEADKRGTLVRKPTNSNPLIPKEEYDLLVEELGGKDSPVVRRELLCEIIRTGGYIVLPEYTPELEQEIVKSVSNRPSFFDTYVSCDLGYKDATALLFAYYDYKNATIIVEEELKYDFQKTDSNIPKLVQSIRDIETKLWTNPLTNEMIVPKRVSDVNPIVTKEISKESVRVNYPIYFGNPAKDDKTAAVNKLRLMLAGKKILINPKCKHLMHDLRYTKWDKNFSKFARNEETSNHGDFLDALLYLMRSINYNRNPYPSYYGMNTKDLMDLHPEKASNAPMRVGNSIDQKTIDIISGMFKRK